MKRIGPHSRPGKLAMIDGRRAEARRMREIRQQLEKHVGASISATERMLIDRIATLMLRIELMDRRSLKNQDMTEHDVNFYLAWTNAVARLLRMLGWKGAAASGPELADYLKDRAA